MEDGCREGGHPLKWQRGRERGELLRTGRECLRRTRTGKNGLANGSVDNTVVLTIVSLKYTVPVEYSA